LRWSESGIATPLDTAAHNRGAQHGAVVLKLSARTLIFEHEQIEIDGITHRTASNTHPHTSTTSTRLPWQLAHSTTPRRAHASQPQRATINDDAEA
jgi:hypothetical protein